MRPTLFEIGGIAFHSYNVILAAAFLTGVWLWFRENDRRARPFNVTPMGALWLFAGVLVGSKVFFQLQYRPLSELHHALYVWEGGLVFYGGLIGGSIAALGYVFYCREDPIAIGDSLMPYVPLFHGVGRLGCFLNGCCWGAPAALPWAITFPPGSLSHAQQLNDGLVAPGEGPLAVHPTQLYAAFGLFTLAGLLFALRRRPLPKGAMLCLYPALYGCFRFGNEFFRADIGRPAAGLTVSQVVSLLLVAGGVAGVLFAWSVFWRRGIGLRAAHAGAVESVPKWPESNNTTEPG